jgi:hypothetical protein
LRVSKRSSGLVSCSRAPWTKGTGGGGGVEGRRFRDEELDSGRGVEFTGFQRRDDCLERMRGSEVFKAPTVVLRRGSGSVGLGDGERTAVTAAAAAAAIAAFDDDGSRGKRRGSG